MGDVGLCVCMYVDSEEEISGCNYQVNSTCGRSRCRGLCACVCLEIGEEIRMCRWRNCARRIRRVCQVEVLSVSSGTRRVETGGAWERGGGRQTAEGEVRGKAVFGSVRKFIRK